MPSSFFVRLNVFATIIAFLFFLPLRAAEYETRHSACPNDAEKFRSFCRGLEENHARNLLALPGAKIVLREHVNGNIAELTDGAGGELAGRGRVEADGKPARIVYYLGRACPISEIAVWTGNGDSRANQDFEIRLADNSAHPGEMPVFPEKPNYGTHAVRGNDGGGYKTCFVPLEGEFLEDGKKFDWIEFRFWQTYPSKAGGPGKGRGTATSWTALIELQALGSPTLEGVFASEEERRIWLIRQLSAKYAGSLDDLGPQAVAALRDPESLRLLVDDLGKTFPDRFDAKKYRSEWEKLSGKLADLAAGMSEFVDESVAENYRTLAEEYVALQRQVALSNPLLDFDRLLVVKRPAGQIVTPSNNSYITTSLNRNVPSELCVLKKPDFARAAPTLETVYQSEGNKTILDPDLDFDGNHVLFSMPGENGRWHLFEQNLEKTDKFDKPVQVTKNIAEIDSFDACYLPDGKIVFGSNACFQGLPCESGRVEMGLLYRLDRKTDEIRQLTFEQDSNWCPTIDNDGRVMYLRWEYSDTPHFFTRILFTMNPDGTKQLAHYGSNSYWPNSLFYAKPIPGNSSRFVGTASGHHTSRPGRLVLFDVLKGRAEADGVVQGIPGRNEKVEPVIMDYLYGDLWPRFLQVHPLGTGEADGAGKYFLVSGNMGGSKNAWGIYLVDVFDNITPILVDENFCFTDPTPIQSRSRPRTIPDRTVPGEKTATFFITDVYYGPGLENVPRDAVKSLRIFTYHFSYPHTGHNDVVGVESAWDVKRILGTVPVEKDGSAFFTSPAHTPISIQPLDEHGQALQLMQSWTVGMQGENVSCIGCHESQNDVTPSVLTAASRRPPHEIAPWRGEVRGFDFLREVQPVLDKYCIGCHDGTQDPSDEIFTTGTDGIKGRPNFKEYRLMTVTDGANRQIGPFYRSYIELRAYVRAPGPESDYHLFNPMEYHVSTSPLFQMLDAGHHGVKLDPEARERLAVWVDLNAPCYGTWTEAHRYWANKELLDWMRIDNKRQMDDLEKYRKLRNYYSELYADVVEDPESDAVPELEMYDRIEKFRKENPPIIPEVVRPTEKPPVKETFYTPDEAKNVQKTTAPEGNTEKILDLGGGVSMHFRWIPPDGSILTSTQKPASPGLENGYWLGETEVTNRQYNRFDPKYDSRYVDEMAKDHARPGIPANQPNQPVSRVSLDAARKFCDWLDENCSGPEMRACRATIPTEAQWEWACRAGASTSFWYGKLNDDFSKYANLADRNLSKFHRGQGAVDFYKRIDVDDGLQIMGDVRRYEPNPFGLYDMHGNVAEITRRDGESPVAVVKGGSWADWPKRATTSFRAEFPAFQKLPNTGFRVTLLVEAE